MPCPDFWRLRSETRVTLPIGATLFGRRREAVGGEGGGTGRGWRRWRRRAARGGAAATTTTPAGAGAKYTSPNGVRLLGRRVRDTLLPTASAAVPSPSAADAGAMASIRRSLALSTLTVRTKATVAASGLPSYESETLGGDGAIRGYEAGELGLATSCARATVEFVVPLGGAQPVALSLFGDAGGGTVPKRGGASNAVGSQGLGLSAGAAGGVGLRYGPFRIDYAINMQGKLKTHVGLVD